MCCHGNASSKLQMAWFFSPAGSVSTSLAWLYEYNCDWDVFFSFSGTLKSFGSKRAEYFTDHSISQTVIGQPRILTPIPWNIIHQRWYSPPLSHHQSVHAAFLSSLQQTVKKARSSLHFTQVVSPKSCHRSEHGHYFYVNLNMYTHFTYIIELFFNWAFLRIPTRSYISFLLM